MNRELQAGIAQAVHTVVGLLVNRDFGALERLTNGVRLKVADIQSALSAYGKTLIEPASSAFEKLDVVEVTNRNPPEYSVWFHLWTKEEGLSDLSLQLTVADLGSDKLRIELDDIHAL